VRFSFGSFDSLDFSPSGLLPGSRYSEFGVPGLQQRLMKTGGRLIKHARYYWLMLAESHLTRRLFGAMARRIAALLVPTDKPRQGEKPS